MHTNVVGWLLAGVGALVLVGDLPGRGSAVTEATRPLSALESTFSFAGQRRAYYVYHPARLGPTPTPLVLALHADGADARQLERTSRLDEEAERYGFTVVYANAGRGSPGALSWDIGGPGKSPDAAFLGAVIDAVSGKFRVDPERIYLTGQAAGATVAGVVACEDPKRFAGLALLDSEARPISCTGGNVLRSAPISSLFEVISDRD